MSKYNNRIMSQIIEFVYKSLSKLIQISNKTWEILLKKIRNRKMNRVKSSLAKQTRTGV